jgi:orotidine-5'-phosphate decarboxylase
MNTQIDTPDRSLTVAALKTNPLIIALDLETAAEARVLVNTLGDAAGFYKVGLELFTSAGMDFVKELKSQGKRVFLDLKMYDIGETVKRAVSQVARVGVDLMTVHAMRQVVLAAAAGRAGSGLKILGVSVLTSFDDGDLRTDGHTQNVSELVELRSRNAVAADADGIVCSALEVARVRKVTGPDKILVIPGVRSAGAAKGDQKRVATPRQAIADGADYLVIGRQVTRSENPRAEFEKILEEIQ